MHFGTWVIHKELHVTPSSTELDPGTCIVLIRALPCANGTFVFKAAESKERSGICG